MKGKIIKANAKDMITWGIGGFIFMMGICMFIIYVNNYPFLKMWAYYLFFICIFYYLAFYEWNDAIVYEDRIHFVNKYKFWRFEPLVIHFDNIAKSRIRWHRHTNILIVKLKKRWWLWNTKIIFLGNNDEYTLEIRQVLEDKGVIYKIPDEYFK